jgi:hypothetical protein
VSTIAGAIVPDRENQEAAVRGRTV